MDTSDITTEAGCKELIKAANEMGSVGGIYNLAVALRDGIFENQEAKMFTEALAPKAVATKHLDLVSRRLCPNLKHFVVFSSVSCGRGNPGQSNYGMANSVMERIIEHRHEQGLPAKAIQWGAIGDVGLLADLIDKKADMEISGTLPQRITNCMEVLDTLLIVDEPVVASMMIAEKRSNDAEKGNVIDVVLGIMSIRDKKSVSKDTLLAQLGMDSLTGVEIQQVLERDYDVVFTAQEMRTLTLRQLEDRVNSKESGGSGSSSTPDMSFMLSGLGDEETSHETILKLESASDEGKKKILIIPGIEGMAGEIWKNIAKQFNCPTYILQLGNADQCETLSEILEAITGVKCKLQTH